MALQFTESGLESLSRFPGGPEGFTEFSVADNSEGLGALDSAVGETLRQSSCAPLVLFVRCSRFLAHSFSLPILCFGFPVLGFSSKGAWGAKLVKYFFREKQQFATSAVRRMSYV